MTHPNLGEVHPPVYQAMLELDDRAARAAAESGLDARLVELVKIRASQLNGCAFCLRMHVADAIAHGESAERLAVIAAWWESQYFTEAERAALQLTERVTRIGDHGRLPDRGVDPAAHLDERQHAAVAWLVVVINAWNRIAITSHYPVGPED
ncbi:MAG: alkylhydroperoxidase [Micrococcales bacterium 73-13]|nr:MAG: alkylhydroperoxidase [Micrococcales bacterium 73-13]